MSLQPLVEKLLLTKIKELNIKREVAAFNLIFDENKLIFRKKGSDTRWKLQEHKHYQSSLSIF